MWKVSAEWESTTAWNGAARPRRSPTGRLPRGAGGRLRRSLVDDEMDQWFEAQLRYYQRCLIEGRDPSELREALAARRDRCLAQLFDAVDELRAVHAVSAEEILQFVRAVLDPQRGVDVEA